MRLRRLRRLRRLHRRVILAPWPRGAARDTEDARAILRELVPA